MNHQQTELYLISDPSQDLLDTVAKAAWGENPPDEQTSANEALDAIAGGAMVEQQCFRTPPLHIVLAGWERSQEYRRAMAPVLEAIARLSTQKTLDLALGLTTGIYPDPSSIQHTLQLAKCLRAHGAQVSDYTLRGLQTRIEHNKNAKSDAACSKILSSLAQWGWMPSDSHACRSFLGSVIESQATQALDTFVGLYETHDVALPARAGKDSISPICLALQERRKCKSHQTKQIDRLDAMIERMLHSGLAGWEPGPFVDWKREGEEWMMQAEAEGAARRLARLTPQQQTPHLGARSIRRM